MSKVGGLGVHELGGGGGGVITGGYYRVGGGGYYIHFEYIWHRLLVFNMFSMTTSNFGGAQPPLSKSGRA